MFAWTQCLFELNDWLVTPGFANFANFSALSDCALDYKPGRTVLLKTLAVVTPGFARGFTGI